MPIFNSNNPIDPNEEMYRECELGLDKEIIAYMQENHELQIRIGGEAFYLFKRLASGSLVQGTAAGWLTHAPQYSTQIWHPTDGEFTHPNVRNQNSEDFVVLNDDVAMKRVTTKSFITYDNEYAIEVGVGTGSQNDGIVKLWFNENFIPGTVTWRYYTICSCADRSTGYPNRACPSCKGTSYPQGWEQWFGQSTAYAPANTILVRTPMAPETRPVDPIGRVKQRNYRHWTLYTPIVDNYDIIVGAGPGVNQGVVYELVSKSDSLWRGILMHQEFDTIRIEESDIRYQLVIQDTWSSTIEQLPPSPTKLITTLISNALIV